MIKAKSLFSLPDSLKQFRDFFMPDDLPWDWVLKIKKALSACEHLEAFNSPYPALSITGDVFIHPTVKLPHVGTIQGPVWIGERCELRPGVYIRGNVIAGKGCVLGNSCEFKNALLLDDIQVPHFSYVGDSVMGNQSHLGAGAILSNFRLDGKNVPIDLPDQRRVDSGMRKLGCLLGDKAQLGCNAVTQPGSILGKGAIVMTGTVHKGFKPSPEDTA